MEKAGPKAIILIYKKLKGAGFEVYFVGGCVRDFLMEQPIKDWDLTTNATPPQIQKNFVEITTYRRESGYENLRHPGKIEWGKTIEEDLSRRDFTINAIALGLAQEIIDPFGGREDIKNKVVQTVGNPEERFNEDALRLLRAIRFANQLKFKIEEKTWKAIFKNALHITKISAERVRAELLKILSTDQAYEGILLLDQAGMLGMIIPELSEGKGVS